MKCLWLIGTLLLAWPGAAQQRLSAPAAPAGSGPEATYRALLADLVSLVGRALAAPTNAQALALLQGPEAQRLIKRAEDERLTRRQQLASLSEAQRKTLYQQLTQSRELRQLDSLSRAAEAAGRFQHSPSVKSSLEWLCYHAAG